jgi:thiamine-phosphate pyrophosphorylase
MNPRLPRLPRLYAIADVDALAPQPVPRAAAMMAEEGVRWIQLRAKRLSGAAWYDLVAATCDALAGSGVALWVDDRADLAALFPVAGLHVGQSDLPPRAARRVLGEGVAIGLSTHDAEQVAAADADAEVAVVAVGPVFPTAGKERPDPVVGLDFVRRSRAATAKTLVAIGGIDAGNAAEVLAAGADAVAVLSAICRGCRGCRGDVRANSRRLLSAVAR